MGKGERGDTGVSNLQDQCRLVMMKKKLLTLEMAA